jgi:hypothetical protein
MSTLYTARYDNDQPLMNGPVYSAASVVSARAQAHFARHLAAARERGDADLASEPDAAAIERIVDVAFWASLRREEGYEPRISLAYLPPEQTSQPLTFERPLPLAPESLTRLAPAVERPGIHLGIWGEGGELNVWGTTRTIPTMCFVLEVVAPGLLVIKHRRGTEAAKYVNVAVLQGDQVKILDERGAVVADCPELVSSLLGFDSATPESVNVLIDLAVSMRAHKRGGALLIVPAGSRTWLDSIVQPISYSVSPPFFALAQLMRQRPDERTHPEWDDALHRVVEAVAGLTAVDGATVLSTDYELLAFGAKIARRTGSARVDRVVVTEPTEDNVATAMHPSDLGGTRHLSAAQFVRDQPDAVAYVASQDGRFTIFAWSPCDQMVHARRVEALLL